MVFVQKGEGRLPHLLMEITAEIGWLMQAISASSFRVTGSA